MLLAEAANAVISPFALVQFFVPRLPEAGEALEAWLARKVRLHARHC